jgi:hypothetical protein
MAQFDRAIRDVKARLGATGLGHLLDGVRRIRVVAEESFHDSRTFVIGLNPADVRKPFAAFHTRAYLLLHELGHHFAEAVLGREGLRRLAPLFGEYDGPYRRLPKPRVCGPDHLSRYAMTHPAEDFAETFAVCLWREWEPGKVDALLEGRSVRCRRKVSALRHLIRGSAARGHSAAPLPRAATGRHGSKRTARKEATHERARFTSPKERLVKILLWLILAVLCWPLALVLLVLYPIVWLVLLPFRIIGITVNGVFGLLRALFTLPARVLGGR